jgi:hypothetical protein
VKESYAAKIVAMKEDEKSLFIVVVKGKMIRTKSRERAYRILDRHERGEMFVRILKHKK